MYDSAMNALWSKERIVLSLLVAQGDAYGLELVERSEGQLKRGTVYVTLGRMEEKGLVVSKADAEPDSHSGMPRRRYRLTALGRRALSAQEAFTAAMRPRSTRGAR
jgi:PadR family transcriptional regulator, regulatory protein PadR